MKPQLGERFLAVLDGVYREAFQGEELRQNLANHPLVVDDKDPRGIFTRGDCHRSQFDDVVGCALGAIGSQ